MLHPLLPRLPPEPNVPAESRAQQEVMAIAEHHPEKLHAENKGLLKMSHKQLHDFAATSHRGLPNYAQSHAARKAEGKA